MAKKRKGGWHGESRRHSLARKGIKTGRKSTHKQSIKKPKVNKVVTKVLTDKGIRGTKEQIMQNIQTGEMRRLFGLDTDSGSLYHHLRSDLGYSDAEAQFEVYESRGLINEVGESGKKHGISKQEYSSMVKLIQEFEYVSKERAEHILESEIIPEMKSEGLPLNSDGMTKMIQRW